MFLTGIKNTRDREDRTTDYFNTLKKRIELNRKYEEAVNSSVDRAISGITKPPPPEENIEKEQSDLNLQKQKAFTKISTILKKQDQAIKFLNKLEDSEILPFNKYFDKFKSTTSGIDVGDANFLINLWDTFKKKTLLTDKETPILGTELESYKRELQDKADNILDYAKELGLDVARVRSSLDKMVNDGDSAAIDKFYFNLLSKGPQTAKVILAKDFGGEELLGEAGPLLTEEVLPEAIREDYIRKRDKAFNDRDKLIDPLRALIQRDRVYHQELKSGPRTVVPRQLDIDKLADRIIIKNHIPKYVNAIKRYNVRINEYLKALGDTLIPADQILSEFELDERTKELLPGLSLLVPEAAMETEAHEGPEGFEEKELKEEKEVTPPPKKNIGFDFSEVSKGDLEQLIKLMEASGKEVSDFIYSSNPDGKFEFNGVKYNLNRNPPTLEKQKEYLLKGFFDRFGLKTSAKRFFADLIDSEEYKQYKEDKEAELQQALEEELEQKIYDPEFQKELDETVTKLDKKTRIKSLKKDAKKLIEQVYTIDQLVINRTLKPVFQEVLDILNSTINRLGLQNVSFNLRDIAEAFRRANNKNEILTNVTGLLIDEVKDDLIRVNDAMNDIKMFEQQKQEMLDGLNVIGGKKSKEKKIIKDRLGVIEGKLTDSRNFFKNNIDFYTNAINAINELESNAGPLSSIISFTSPDKYHAEMEVANVEKQPLVDRYNNIRNVLHNEGVNITAIDQEVTKLLEENNFSERIAPQRLIHTKPIGPVKIKIDPNKRERARRLSIELEEMMQRYINPEESKEEKELKEEEGNPFEALPVEEPAGSGMKKPRKKADRLKKIKFGKYSISGRALGSGVLDLRTDCNKTTARMPRTPISSKLEKAINYLIKNGDIDMDQFEDLPENEKKLFIEAIEISDVELNSIPFSIFKKFSAKDINKEIDELINRYHILVGELAAGNNAKEILIELKGILFKLLQKKKIDRIYANELLVMINAVS